MSTNDRDRNTNDGRTPRRNSARLEADYRREMRKAAEERLRRRLEAEDDGMRLRGQEATESRYRTDYRDRNRSAAERVARRGERFPQERLDDDVRYPSDASRSRQRREGERSSTRVSRDNREYDDARPRSGGRSATAYDDRQTARRDANRPYGQRRGGYGAALDEGRVSSRGGGASSARNGRAGAARDGRSAGARDDRSGVSRDRRPAGNGPNDPQRRSRDDRAQGTRRSATHPDAREQRGRGRDPELMDRGSNRGSRAGSTGSHLPARLLKIVLLAIVVLIALTMVVRFAASVAKPPVESPLPAIEEQISSRASAYRLPADEVAARLEAQGVEDTWAEKAGELAQEDNRFMVMAQRSDDLGREGTEVSNKLVKLAVSDPEAVDYVYDFIDEYPHETAEPYTEKVTKGVVPQLYQWDERWAFIEYSGTSFGCTGCGPTSMSMAYMGATGKNDKSPADMAKLAADEGFETDYEGTMNQFFVTAAYELDLNVVELDIDSESLTWALENKMPVICNVGPGDFTLYGHFFVISGLNDDGTVNVNDPFSSVNSSQTWDMDLILSQTIALYAYSEGEMPSDADGAEAEGEGEVAYEDEYAYEEEYYGW